MRAALLTLALTLLLAAPAGAITTIHAHRGGSVIDGVPAFPENTMPAFEHAAASGWVLELDVVLTSDRVPIVFHDSTLDRVTPCTGPVGAIAFADLRARCPVDVLGSPGSAAGGRPMTGGERPVPVPRLTEVLDLARRTGARLNVEIKNVPTEGGFDPSDAFAETVVETLAAAQLPSSQLIVQSFWPPNLDVSERLMPTVPTSLLTLGAMNDGAPAYAAARGYEWVSPQAPPSRQAVSGAHELGRQVVPYTPNDPATVKGAAAAAVDAIITDDPAMARRALREVEPPPPPIPPPPTAAQCERVRASRSLPTVRAYARDRDAPRVFAMQFKQELRHVETYASFRTKIECMIRERVVPRLAKGRPNVVAFNEDIGLMTIATGTRGLAARELFGPGRAPGCESQGAPCTTLAALGAVSAAYGRELALYRKRFPQLSPVAGAFVAATDTFGRGWMQVFSDMARRYGVYILGSNNQAPFRESTDPSEIATLADPDLPLPPSSVFVATEPKVYNEVFLWGPRAIREDGPWPLRNMVASNKKVPLTSIEQQIDLTPGASTGPDAIENLRPYRIPGTQARIGFATSLPAFVYGAPPPAGTDPCSDTSRWYMRCLDRLGTNLVMQDEANPGRWGVDAGSGAWQPLEWMTSTWRAVADPTVSFDYNVTPHMVGNLADLPFDGQTAITQRGLQGRRACTYVGNTQHEDGDEQYASSAGPKREFIAILPWVTPDAPRAELRDTAAKLAPDSGDPLENDYVEGAIAADLPFPPKPRRRNCVR
ncbi:MAG TPA: glycerophosphodiester phosphodiesterase family protein [Solirubrobacteraceae bacterium]|nr:glycerophosphodiester phosphodiesterase family protein [Solirubrobacteraceae bacterium]